MPARRSIAVVIAIAALFLIANRAAYEGYFSGDDLDNIEWTSRSSAATFAKGLVTPIFDPDNFRPVGHAVYWLMYPLAGFNFAPYLAIVQLLHGIVTLLIYALARRLGATAYAAATGALFFVFHMTLFGAFWKPMYLFDVLCALFALLSVFAWLHHQTWRGWLLAFVCFWLAYKSKEVAVMLPAVLLLLEYRGQRRWLRLAPFFAVSLSFGIQALLTNRAGEYHLAISAQTLATTASFYFGHLFLRPIGVAALLVLLVLARDRFGGAAALLIAMPMLALPGRMAPVYLYLPLAFLALLASSTAERIPKLAMLALLVWLGLNFTEMRRLRNDALAEARQASKYVSGIQRNIGALHGPGVQLDGFPPSIHVWGAKAAVVLLTGLPISTDPTGQTLSWQPGEEELYVFGLAAVPYLDMRTGTPIPALQAGGWYEPERETRWSMPVARLFMQRPAAAREFEWRVFMPEAQLRATENRVSIEAVVGRQLIGPFLIETSGWHTFRAMVAGRETGGVNVELHVTPAYRPDPNGRELGVAVGAIGFQ